MSEDKLKSISDISEDELRKIIGGDISIYKEYFSNNIKDGMKYLQLIKEGKDENKTIRLVANDDSSLSSFFGETLALFLSVAARLLPNTVSGIANLKLENGFFWCCDDEGAKALSMNLFEADKINLKFIKLDEYVTFHKSILENKKISKETLCKYIVKVNSMQQTLGNLKGRLFYFTLNPLGFIQTALDPRSDINEGVEAVKTAIANKFGEYVDALQKVNNGVLSRKNKKFLNFMKNIVNIYNGELNEYTKKVLCSKENSKDFYKTKNKAMNNTTEFPKFVLKDCFEKIEKNYENIKCYLCLAKIVIINKLATAFHKKEEDIKKLIETMNKISDLDTNYSEEKLNEIKEMLEIESQQPNQLLANGSNNASLNNDIN